MLERRPRRAEVVLLTQEFAIGLPPVLRDGYRHFLRAADLRLLDLDQDLTNSLRGIKRQNQRLFNRLCGNPATCPRSSLTVERMVDRMARMFRANEHRRDSGDILLGGATRRHGLMCCQNFFAQHLILHVLETSRRLHTTFQGLPASPRDLRCYEYTHAIAFCRNQKKRPGAESERRAGIGHVAVGVARQCYDLQLTQYGENSWRATFYTTGTEHSPHELHRIRLGANAPARRPGRSSRCNGAHY